MNIAILGTGIVARTVTPRLLAAGHSVVLGSRNPQDEVLAEWLAQQTGDAQAASHADAVSSGELVINALPGHVALSALTAINPADPARATEHLFPLLAALFAATGTLRLNFAVIREPGAINVEAN
jgi:3-hydroxyisobutyrate dehydrogenase-like beta-hydroxyacid dehydrogenase